MAPHATYLFLAADFAVTLRPTGAAIIRLGSRGAGGIGLGRPCGKPLTSSPTFTQILGEALASDGRKSLGWIVAFLVSSWWSDCPTLSRFFDDTVFSWVESWPEGVSNLLQVSRKTTQGKLSEVGEL